MKRIFTLLTMLVMVFCLTVTAHAGLIDMGGGLIYDDDLDILWLKDANYAYTSGYDADGRMNWWDAVDWANNLIYYDSVRDVYYDDWRLPSAYNQDGSGPDYSYSSGSELGHLYYIELGNEPVNGLRNTGPFDNVKPLNYWFGTYTDGAWYYGFGIGQQYTRQPAYSDGFYAWAVRDGPVVPEPISSILLDIKPQSCPNPLNTKSQGVLPVAILGSENIDVSNIDPASIRLAGVAPIRNSIEDVSTPVLDKQDECDCTTEGGDGFADLTMKFDTQEIVNALGEVADGDELVLTLTGELFDGTSIEGEDCIVVLSKGGKGKKK